MDPVVPRSRANPLKERLKEGAKNEPARETRNRMKPPKSKIWRGTAKIPDFKRAISHKINATVTMSAKKSVFPNTTGICGNERKKRGSKNAPTIITQDARESNRAPLPSSGKDSLTSKTLRASELSF